MWLGTVVALLFCQAAQAKGLPKQAKKQVEERYKKSKMAGWGADAGSFKEWGTVLVAVRRFPMMADRREILAPWLTVTVDIKDDRTIEWSATFEDPVFFTEPFTVKLDMDRRDYRVMDYSCNENNRDVEHLVPTFGILR